MYQPVTCGKPLHSGDHIFASVHGLVVKNNHICVCVCINFTYVQCCLSCKTGHLHWRNCFLPSFKVLEVAPGLIGCSADDLGQELTYNLDVSASLTSSRNKGKV